MNFTLVQSELYRCLQLVSGVVPTRTSQPNLSSVRIEATADGQLSLTGTDLDTFLVTYARASVEEPGVVTVPARRLLEIVKELPTEVVQIKSTASGISLSCAAGKFRMMGPDPDEFPSAPEISEDRVFAVEADTLDSLIRKTGYAVSTDNTRAEMTGVYTHVLNGELRFVATDGHRLARASHRGDYPNWGDIIIPPKALSMLQRLLPDAQESVSLSTNKRYCLFNLGSCRLYTRLLDGHFPPYEDVIARCQPDKKIRADREQLLACIRRVAVFSETHNRLIQLSLESGTIRVSVQTQNVGEAEDTIPSDYQGQPFHVGFNATYLLELLRTIETEEIFLQFQTPTSAGIITPAVEEGEPELLCLVMPLRLPGADAMTEESRVSART
ncbi:MAG: DNA polymerase III subunit beta [Candidatus Eisenbacteria bacterium]|nr:DNA polymerase III subunit beta [Candidatus Eisenbacteria bacterium]MCC7140744.1 DNA polymerase III subunit beta [Candidatus Eisenbacteria bacterium]